MYEIPSEGALYHALMQYGEIMTISKSRLMKMQINTHDAAISVPRLTEPEPNGKLPNGSQALSSRNTPDHRRSKSNHSLEKAEDTLIEAETYLIELEKRLATIERSGRVIKIISRRYLFTLAMN